MTKKIRQQKVIRYLNKDFDAFKSDIIEYSKAHFADVTTDFSDASIGGLFTDMFAYVGDVMSFYIDHQFNELFIDTAREPKNVTRIAKQLGVKPQPPSPAVVNCSFFIEAPSATDNSQRVVPDINALFKLKATSLAESDDGIKFELLDDIDFSDFSDATITVSRADATNRPTHFYIQKNAQCLSGERKSFTITVPNKYVRFRQVELPEKNITDIISITDTEGNSYFEVDYLTQDTVFESIRNNSMDRNEVPFLVNIKPVPYRYVAEYNPESELITLTFGSGQAGTIDDDIVPDPSEFAIPFFGKKTLKRFSVNPEQFLKTRTLGIAPMGTTLTIEVRVGGGISHNVAERSINSVDSVLIEQLTNATSLVTDTINTLDVTNFEKASGGEDKQTLEDLKANAGSNFASQNRLVTRSDYLARLYSMPSRFGKVFRAFIKRNDVSSLSVQIHILSRNVDGKLIISPDSLKKNIKIFINEFKMITDTVDILDANIINIGLNFKIVTASNVNHAQVLNMTLRKLIRFFSIENFQISQPIIEDEVKSVIYNTEGVLSISNFSFVNFSGIIDNRKYSDMSFSVSRNLTEGILLCPDDSIFEIKFPAIDIKGSTI